MNREKLESLIAVLSDFPPEATLLDREKDTHLALSREKPVSPFFGVAFSPYRSVGEACFQERQAFVERAITQVSFYFDLDVEIVKALLTPECLDGKHYTVQTIDCITAVEHVLAGKTTEHDIWKHVFMPQPQHP